MFIKQILHKPHPVSGCCKPAVAPARPAPLPRPAQDISSHRSDTFANFQPIAHLKALPAAADQSYEFRSVGGQTHSQMACSHLLCCDMQQMCACERARAPLLLQLPLLLARTQQSHMPSASSTTRCRACSLQAQCHRWTPGVSPLQLLHRPPSSATRRKAYSLQGMTEEVDTLRRDKAGAGAWAHVRLAGGSGAVCCYCMPGVCTICAGQFVRCVWLDRPRLRRSA